MTNLKTMAMVAGLVLSAAASQAAVDYNTGKGLPLGASDPYWKVNGSPALVANNYGGAWLANDSTSQWLSKQLDGNMNPVDNIDPVVNGDGHYSYTLDFTANTGSGKFSWISDNSSKLYLDNAFIGEITIEKSFNPSTPSWKTVDLSWANGGLHTITVDVTNWKQDGGNPEGFRATFAPVPEPSTYLAGLSALGMLGMAAWRNRK